MATGGDTTGGGEVYATDCKLTVGSVGDHSEVFLVKQQQQQQHTHHHHHVPESEECEKLRNIIANTNQHIATHCPHGYVETKALRELKRELEKRGACLVLGLPGHGKTALALQAMGSLAASHNLKPVYLKKPEQWEWIPGEKRESQKSETSLDEDSYSKLENKNLSETEKISPKEALTHPPLPLPHCDGPDQHKHESQRYIVLLDDAFGQGHYDDAKKRAWEEVFDLMLAKVRAKQVKLIIVSRAHIYETCKKSLSAHQLFHHAHKIDLSKADYWASKDKEAILYNFLRRKKVHLNRPIQEFIDASENCHQIGFPQMCRFFVDEKQAQLQGPEFFRKPLQFLQKHFEILTETDIKSYHVLLLACLEGGFISRADLSFDNQRLQIHIQRLCEQFGIRDSMTIRDVQSRLESLCGVYLTKDAEGNFRFTHQSISDSLLVAMCRHNLEQALAVCSIQQLCEYIQTDPITTDCSGLTFTVPKSQWPLLAERLVKAMTSEKLPQALHHQCLQNREFVSCLLAEHLSSSHLSRMLEIECPCAIDIPSLKKMWYTYKHSKTQAKTKGILAACLLKSTPDLFLHVLGKKDFKKLSKKEFHDHLSEALLAACYVGNEEFVTPLLKKGADVTWDTLSVTCSSALDNVHLLAELWQKLRGRKMTLDLYQDLLWMCCVKGKVRSLRYLLTKARPKNCQNVLDTVITEILKETHPREVTHVNSFTLKRLPKLLFELKSAGATFDQNAIDIWFAAGHPDSTVLKELLSARILENSGDKDKAAGRFFCESAHWGSVACLELLIDTLGTSAINAVDCKNRTLLHIAALNQHVHVIDVLLKHNARTDLLDCKKRTSLHLHALTMSHSDEEDEQQAAERLRVGELLVKNTRNINQGDEHGRTPLHLAVASTNRALVEILLKHKANPTLQDKLGRTSLHFALEYNNHFLVKILLKYKARLDLRDCFGGTPVHTAALCDAVTCLLMLRKRILAENLVEVPDKNDRTPLHLYALSSRPCKYFRDEERLRVEEMLVKNTRNVNMRDRYVCTPLHLASAKNKLSLVEILLEHKAQVDLQDASRQTPLHTAARCGSTECLQVLIAVAVANQTPDNNPLNLPDKDRRTPLHLYALCPQKSDGPDTRENAQQIAEKRRLETLLVKNTTNIDQQDKDERTPLHLAALIANQNLMKVLLEHKANPDLQDSIKQASLHLAVENGNTSAIQLLLKHKANPDLQDTTGRTPLHLAVVHDDLAQVEMLLEHKARTDIQDIYGQTPIHIAAQHGFVSCLHTLTAAVVQTASKKNPLNMLDRNQSVPLLLYALSQEKLGGQTTKRNERQTAMTFRVEKLLVKNTADVNQKDKDGHASLHLAVLRGKASLVELLLKQKANPDVQDAKGRIPLHFAAMSILLDERQLPLHLMTVRTNEPNNVCCSLKVETLLIEKTTDVNIQDDEGRTALHLAAGQDSLTLVVSLLARGASTDLVDKEGRLALHLMAFRKPRVHGKKETRLTAETALVEQTADINFLDEENKTPLHLAAGQGSLTLVVSLLARGARTDLMDKEGRLALHLMAFRKPQDHGEEETRLTAETALVQQTADLNVQDSEGLTPLHMAVQHGSLHMAMSLLKQDVKIDVVDNMQQLALHKMTLRDFEDSDDHELLEQTETLLVEKSPDLDAQDKEGKTALHVALAGGNLSLSFLLLKNKANTNLLDNRGRRPLHVLAASDCYRCLEPNEWLWSVHELVDVSTDINAQDSEGRTPLHLAVQEDSVHVAIALLKRGARTDIVDNDQCGLLHAAAACQTNEWTDEEEVNEVVNSLLRSANVNYQNMTGKTPLHSAAEHKNWSLVKALLENGANPDFIDKRRRLPLHLLAISKHIFYLPSRVVAENLLMDKTGDVNIQDEDNKTPLHLAAGQGSLTLVVSLLEQGARTDLVDKEGRLALHLMAFRNPQDQDYRETRLTAETTLVEQTADLNVQDSEGLTPLHLAVQHGSLHMAMLLLKRGARIDLLDNQQQLPLHKMALRILTSTEMAWWCQTRALLLVRSANLNFRDTDGKTSLHLAAEHSNTHMISWFVDNKARTDLLDNKGRRPLHAMAASNEYRGWEPKFWNSAWTLLADRTDNINVQDREGFTALHLAVQQGSLFMAMSLMKRGARTDLLDSKQQLPLHKMALREFEENDDRSPWRQTETFLVEKSADLNVQDVNKKTALHLAAEDGGLLFIHVLVKNKARTDLQDNKGRCPLHAMAASDKYRRWDRTDWESTLTELLAATADVNLQDAEGRTPLHMAAGQGSLTLVVPLLARGARTDLADKEGHLPLHCMAARTLERLKDQERTDEAMTELMERTLDINAQDSSRCTALQLAVDQENWSLVKLLLKHGAKPDMLDEKSLSLLKSQTFATTELLHKDRRRGLVMEDVGSSAC